MTERREFYDEHGYAMVPDVVPIAQVQALCDEIEQIANAMRARRGTLEASWPGAYRDQTKSGISPDSFRCDSIHNVQRFSARTTRLLTDPVIISLFTELLGPNIALHHTKYHHKPAHSGAPFPLHQDYPHFPHAGTGVMLGALFLDDANPHSGCLGVVPGSQHLGPLPIVGPEEKYLDPRAYPLDALTLLPASRGSMLFMNYLTIHGSTANRSNSDRRVLFIQVRDPAERPVKEVHASHAQGMMLAGAHHAGGRDAS